MNNNIVYYWDGGRELGRWREAHPNVFPEYLPIETLVERIQRGGRVAFRGHTDIGAPEGPPKEERFQEIGM